MSTSILGWLLPGVNGYSLSLKVLKMYRVTALPAGRIAQHHYLDVMKSICANDTTLPCHEACCLDLSGKPIPIRENPSTRFPWDQGREPVFFFSLHMHRCRPLLFGFRFACMCHDIFLVVAILRQRESRRRATMSPPTAADYKLAQLGPFHPTVQEKWLFHYRSCKLVIRFHFTAVSVSIINLHNHNCKQQQTTHPSLTRQRSHTRSYVPYGNNVLQASFTGWRGYHRSSARRD